MLIDHVTKGVWKYFPPPKMTSWFYPRPIDVGFMVKKVVLAQVSPLQCYSTHTLNSYFFHLPSTRHSWQLTASWNKTVFSGSNKRRHVRWCSCACCSCVICVFYFVYSIIVSQSLSSVVSFPWSRDEKLRLHSRCHRAEVRTDGRI
jgi:hypothetical protein